MTSKAQEYLSVAVRLANTSLTETERSKIHDQLRTIKQSFDSADWDALITWSNSPTIRAELHKQKILRNR
ncbi:MAG: hypothetical protein IKJ62_02760 [Alphaproteobacteria bacterium]|nr:hypothetical protein [Alphaproteobacteria bacterium]